MFRPKPVIFKFRAHLTLYICCSYSPGPNPWFSSVTVQTRHLSFWNTCIPYICCSYSPGPNPWFFSVTVQTRHLSFGTHAYPMHVAVTVPVQTRDFPSSKFQIFRKNNGFGPWCYKITGLDRDWNCNIYRGCMWFKWINVGFGPWRWKITGLDRDWNCNIYRVYVCSK